MARIASRGQSHHESGAAVGGEARPGEEARMSALVLHPVGAGSHLGGMFFNFLEKRVLIIRFLHVYCGMQNVEERINKKNV